MVKPASEWRVYASRRAAYCIVCTREKDRLRDATPARKASDRLQSVRRAAAKRAAAKAWRVANRVRYLAQLKEWREQNHAYINEYASRRRGAVGMQTPGWANVVLMREIYACAKVIGWHVDHVVPLKGRLVSGLHTPLNLRIVPPAANRAKSNRFEVQ